MQNLTLRHIYYTQLDSMTWCATAQIQRQPTLWTNPLLPLAANILYSPPISLQNFYWQYYTHQNTVTALKNAAHKRQQQRSGVRLLLQNLLSKLGITDTLDESQFPYQLVNSRYYVCFSHSGDSRLNDKVAVVISCRRAVGIDIETQDIAWHIVQRFYHVNEIAILANLPAAERKTASKYLWQLKESFIKIHQYKLAQGLGIDYAYLIPELMAHVTEPVSLLKFIDDEKSKYQIAVLVIQQAVVVF